MKHRKKAIVLGVSALLAVGLLLFGGWLLFGQQQKQSAPTQQAPAAQIMPTAKPTLSEANLRLLKDSLNSQEIATQSKALTPELRESFVQQGQSMVPVGSKTIIYPETFQVAGDRGAIVEADIAGKRRYLLLAKTDGTWFLFHTEVKDK